jgi:hypothetical protein
MQAAIAAESVEIFIVQFPLVGGCSEEGTHSLNSSADQMNPVVSCDALLPLFFGHAAVTRGYA